MGCGEVLAYLVVAFYPACFLVGVDVEGACHFASPQVRGEIFDVWGPVHAAGWVAVGQSDVVHVHTLTVATRFVESETKDIGQYAFTDPAVDLVF